MGHEECGLVELGEDEEADSVQKEDKSKGRF